MAGITAEDKKFIHDLLGPIKDKIELIAENQKSLFHKQESLDSTLRDFMEIQNSYILDFELLKISINGNGSKGIKDILKDHISYHERKEKEEKQAVEKKQLVVNTNKNKNRALIVTMLIAIISAAASIITSLISIGG